MKIDKMKLMKNFLLTDHHSASGLGSHGFSEELRHSGSEGHMSLKFLSRKLQRRHSASDRHRNLIFPSRKIQRRHSGHSRRSSLTFSMQYDHSGFKMLHDLKISEHSKTHRISSTQKMTCPRCPRHSGLERRQRWNSALQRGHSGLGRQPSKIFPDSVQTWTQYDKISHETNLNARSDFSKLNCKISSTKFELL